MVRALYFMLYWFHYLIHNYAETFKKERKKENMRMKEKGVSRNETTRTHARFRPNR